MTNINANNFDKEVGQRLKAARLSAGWNQTKLGQAIGVTFQQVQKYETGTNRLPANKYPILADVIGFDASDLLRGDKTYLAKTDVDKDMDRLAIILIKLKKDERDLVIDLATRLSKMK